VRLTPLLNAKGTPNVLSVRVDATGENSRWYAGAGIYRHVRVTVTPKVHVALWGLQAVPLNSLIDVAARTAMVEVTAQVQNDGLGTATAVSASLLLRDSTGAVVCSVDPSAGFTVRPGEVIAWVMNCSLTGVQLWSPSR
jgi:beta-galactosidase